VLSGGEKDRKEARPATRLVNEVNSEAKDGGEGALFRMERGERT